MNNCSNLHSVPSKTRTSPPDSDIIYDDRLPTHEGVVSIFFQVLVLSTPVMCMFDLSRQTYVLRSIICVVHALSTPVTCLFDLSRHSWTLGMSGQRTRSAYPPTLAGETSKKIDGVFACLVTAGLPSRKRAPSFEEALFVHTLAPPLHARCNILRKLSLSIIHAWGEGCAVQRAGAASAHG